MILRHAPANLPVPAAAVLTLLAAGAGLAFATLPLDIAAALCGLAALGLLALITPIAPLAVLLIVAPLRTLIATEADYPLPLDIGQLALLGVLFFWVAFRANRRQKLPGLTWTPVYLPLLGFFAAGGLTAFSAFSLGAWATEWLKWAEILVLVALVMNVGAGQRWRWLMFALVISGVANALVGVYEFFGGSGALHLLINNRFFRAFGTFGQPNPFGGFMGLLAPLALAMLAGYAVTLWRKWRQHLPTGLHDLAPVAFYGLASGLIVAGVVMSWSRGAWLAFAVSLGVVIFALPRRLWQSLALIGVIAAAVGLLWFSGRFPASVAERISSATQELFAFDDVRGVDINPENYAVVERLAHWQAALNMARSYPWLGVGLGNYEIAYPDFRLMNWKFPLGHAHNYYLNVLGEAGIIGLTAYLALWVVLVTLTWRARRHPNTLARFAVLGLLGSWTYLSVHSLTDNLYVNNLFLHLGVMLGILAVLYRQARSSVRTGMS